MTTLIRPRWAARAAALGTASLLAAVALAGLSGPASADTLIHAKYKVTGSTYLAGPGFTLALGPGTLSSTLDASTGKLTAELSMPEATGSFTQFGVIPVTATTQFINDGPTTGKLNLKTERGFNVLAGGNLAGSYAIPSFSHCGLATPLINLTIPATDNTIALKLGKA